MFPLRPVYLQAPLFHLTSHKEAFELMNMLFMNMLCVQCITSEGPHKAVRKHLLEDPSRLIFSEPAVIFKVLEQISARNELHDQANKAWHDENLRSTDQKSVMSLHCQQV